MAGIGIYTRISRDRVGAGLGVERQETECRDLATRNGWDRLLPFVYRDNDLSAYSGKPRPGYREMLADITAGTITNVITWHTDRLHRSPAELEEYISTCEPRGVPTHTVKAGPLDLATPSGRMVARQLGAVARFEVEHQIERQQAAKAQAAADGRWKGGRRPYGYEADGVTVRPSEAAQVRMMAEQILAGRSLRGLVAELNESGETTSTGAPWRVDVVRSVMLRPRNAGLMEHRKKVLDGVTALWEPIVEEDLWRAVVGILTDPSRRTSPGSARRWLLSGIARCSVCDETCVATSVGNHPGSSRLAPSYTCRAKHVVRIAAEVDRLVVDTVVGRLSQPEAARRLTRKPKRSTVSQHLDLTALRERLDGLAREFADDNIDARQLREGTARLRNRIEQATLMLAQSNRGSVLEGVIGASDVRAVWDGLKLDRHRAIVDALVMVTLLPSAKGRRREWRTGESYFNPESVLIEWREWGTA